MRPPRGTALLVALVLAGSCAAQAKRAPESARAKAQRLNTLGAGYMGMQNFPRALLLFRQAQAADKTFGAARLNQGIALLNQQKYAEARKVLLEIVAADPGNARAWYNLGLLYKATADPQQARDAFQNAARVEPQDADVRYFIGQLQLDAKQFPEAIESLHSVLAIDPFHASAEFALARAYQRSGDTPNARLHSERFQKLTRENIAAPLAVGYGQQGKLSLVEAELPQTSAAPAPIPIRFTDVTKLTGLASSSRSTASTTNAACWFDFNADGWPDLFVGNLAGHGALLKNVAGRFQNASRRLGLAAPATACATGDFNNDGQSDLAAIVAGQLVLLQNQSSGNFRDVTNAAKLENVKVGSVIFVDYDHDGDLDLIAGSLLQNNGNGTFQPAAFATRLGPTATTDINNDNAVDLLATGGSTELLLNQREGNFASTQAISNSVDDVTVADFDRDGWIDVAAVRDGSLVSFRNEHGDLKSQSISNDCAHATASTALDFDNDGFIDIAVLQKGSARFSICLLRNEGLGTFKTLELPSLDRLQVSSEAMLVPADFDNDGDTDLLLALASGDIKLLRNDGGNRNSWLKIALKGVADSRTGYGTKVETYAGGGFSKLEYNGYSGNLTQSNIPLLFGLGDAAQAERIRLRWPTGVVQDEVERLARRVHKISEIDRRSSSCPLLFTWNGKRFEFISDLIGAGVIGHWVGPGERNIPDPTEYVKVESRQLQPANGRLKLRFMEPMEEVNYFDQARLIAIDHPADVEVFPNERFVSGPPFPDGRPIISQGALSPMGAWDDSGNDVLPKLVARDRAYVDGFKLDKFSGFARLHTLEIELPAFDPHTDLRLLMYGYTEYFTANSMYAAYQSGLVAIAPYVEAEMPDGSWRRIIDDLGFPAGLPRMMVADLTGKVRAGTTRLRIVTNLQIYWDQILIDTTAQDNATRSTAVPLLSAGLRFFGYPKPISEKSPGDLRYDYHSISNTGPFATPRGAYTRFGDVKKLVESSDDRFVIFGPGEEVTLEFDAKALPDLPQGWRRDYFFYADGFVKDMDFAGADSFAVAPLPFHGMSGYPYPASQQYPDHAADLEYQLEYNDRFVFAPPARSYRFNYQHSPEE